MPSRAVPLVQPPPSASAPPPKRLPLIRRVLKVILGAYMRPYHHLAIEGAQHLPARGPVLVVLNHASLLDVPALMVLDPFPDTSTVVKSSMFKIPVIGWVLRQWGAISVEREGRDSAGIRRMLGVLRDGGALAVAAEGTRTRSGRLGQINPVLARIAASADVPLLPVGIGGSYAAMPPGARFPRPVKITVRVGPVFRLKHGTGAPEAAHRIQTEIARLLPPEMQPLG
jgi:1-acyl-sn-glycerol-3-phosphate acyltransferase